MLYFSMEYHGVKVPFADVDASTYKSNVVVAGGRPDLTHVPFELQPFLTRAWSLDIEQRPSFSEALDALLTQLPTAIVAETQVTVMQNGRRRSALFQLPGQALLFPPPIPGVSDEIVERSALKAKEFMDSLNSRIATHFEQHSESNDFLTTRPRLPWSCEAKVRALCLLKEKCGQYSAVPIVGAVLRVNRDVVEELDNFTTTNILQCKNTPELSKACVELVIEDLQRFLRQDGVMSLLQ
jgi:hypothetical protein